MYPGRVAVPLLVVTTTFTVLGGWLSGERQITVVSVGVPTMVACTPPNVTLVAFNSPVPVIVTSVPPAAGPVVGESVVMDGLVTPTVALPVIVGVPSAVAVIVRLPALLSVPMKVCTPRSAAVKVESEGRVACGSELANCTVPVYPVTVRPPPSRAVTVNEKVAPA